MPDLHDHRYPRFSDAEYERRHGLARALMDRAGMDALLVFGSSAQARADQANLAWLAGFAGMGPNYLLFPLRGEPVLWAQTLNHLPQAQELSIFADVRPGGTALDWAATGEVIGKEVSRRGLRSVGVVGMAPYQHHARLVETAPRTGFRDLSDPFKLLRVTKSAEELDWIRRGAAMTDAVVEALQREVRAGMREHEAFAVIQRTAAEQHGELQVGFFGSTSPADPDCCVPRQFPSSRVIRAGDVLFTELSVARWGYAGQALRTYVVGDEPHPTVRRLHRVAAELYQQVLDLLRPGVRGQAVLDAADVVARNGFEMVDALVHGFAVGILPPSLRSHQQPWSDRGAGWEFAENQTVVIQPNPVTRDHRLGVQVGNLCLIGAEGARPLHRPSVDLLVCAA